MITVYGAPELFKLVNVSDSLEFSDCLTRDSMFLIEMKYRRAIYNFWKRKYILASFKYMSSIFQIYGRYILANVYIKYM